LSSSPTAARHADQVKQLWCALAEETVTGLPAETVAELPRVLNTLTGNVDPRRTARPHGTTPAGDYEPSALGWVREHVEQIMRTGTTDGVTMNGLPTVLMTYRGARTGKIRKTPVMRVEQDGTVNRAYRAREVFDDEKAIWWRRAVNAFPDYADYQRKTDREIPVVVLEPVNTMPVVR
jgi:hypothetical protein